MAKMKEWNNMTTQASGYTAEEILSQLNSETKMGELRKVAKDIKKDHELAMELWASGEVPARLLATLIMDKKELNQEIIDQLDEDMQVHTVDDRNKLMDWLLSNQLTKNKKGKEMIASWKDSSSALQRRTYWYYEARQRWTGKAIPENNGEILSAIEEDIVGEDSEVQWAMNFTAGWIGVYDEQYRERCAAIGERIGLYKGEMVSKGCTPNYLPEFIEMEVAKREK
jgi:3-methyladenine DNA glycosylase AlkD